MTSRALSLSVLCVLYAGFSLALFIQGISPRAVLLPIAPRSYYLAQTLFVGPLFILLAYVFSRVVRATAGLEGAPAETFDALAPRYAWPIVVLFLIPDLLVFLLFGHAALAPAMRYYAPLAPLVIIVATTAWLRHQRSVGLLRAIAASLAGLFVQGAMGAPFLR